MIDPNVEEPDIETWPAPGASECVLAKGAYRVTDNAKLFIVRCFMVGMMDSAINAKLRARKFILAGEPDVFSRTLYRIREEEKRGQGLTNLYHLYKLPVRASNLAKIKPTDPRNTRVQTLATRG